MFTPPHLVQPLLLACRMDVAYAHNTVEGCSPCINFTRDPDVLPLLLITNPSAVSSVTNSLKVKSFGCAKNLFISFSLALAYGVIKSQR
jgi:hypothetical protein